jgi:valyl-tRNA synthetase
VTPIVAFFNAGSAIGSTRPEVNNVYLENRDIIHRLANVSAIEQKDSTYYRDTPQLGWTQVGGPFIAVLYEKQVDVTAERERLIKEIARLEKLVANDERKLNDPVFLTKAPAHIVEGARKQLAENTLLLEKARAALDALPPE